MNINPKRQPLFRFILETSEGNNTIRHNRGKITLMQIIMWFLLEISCEKRNSLGAMQFRDEREWLWTRRSHFFHIGTWVLMMLNSQSQDVHFFFSPPIQTSNSCLPCPKPLPRLKGSKQAVYLQGWSVQRQALKPRAPHGYTPQPAPRTACDTQVSCRDRTDTSLWTERGEAFCSDTALHKVRKSSSDPPGASQSAPQLHCDLQPGRRTSSLLCPSMGSQSFATLHRRTKYIPLGICLLHKRKTLSNYISLKILFYLSQEF